MIQSAFRSPSKIIPLARIPSRTFVYPIIALFFVIHLSAVASAKEEPAAHDWHDVAKIRGFSDQQISTLEREGFLIVDESLKQAYQIYAKGESISFSKQWVSDEKLAGTLITSDVVIAASNTCLDQSFLENEARQMVVVRNWLQGLWDALPSSTLKATPGEAGLLAEGLNHARFVLAVPLTLLGGETSDLDRPTRERVKEELGRIEAAAEVIGPPWCEGQTIDYRTMRPPEMYRVSPVLTGFFQTRFWLSQLKFNVERDRDLVAMLILSDLDSRRDRYVELGFNSIKQGCFNPEGSWRMESMFQQEAYLHNHRAPSLLKTLADIRTAKSAKLDSANIIRTHDEEVILPPVVLQRTKESSVILPHLDANRTGLAAGAWLKFRIARDQFDAGELKQIDALPGRMSRFGTGGAYFYALQSLAAETDAAAVPLFHHERWKLKSLQTALAGWAHFSADRPFHARVACCTSSGGVATGNIVIEPVPVFWARMADYLEQAADMELSYDSSARVIAEAVEARWWARKIAQLGTGTPPREWINEIAELSDWSQTSPAQVEAMKKLPVLIPSEPLPNQTEDSIGAQENLEPQRVRTYEPLLAALTDWAQQCETTGKAPYAGPPFGKRWRGSASVRHLARDCRHLEALCQKQLRGVEFDAEDRWFLQEFCSDLRPICFDYSSFGGRVEDTGARVLPFPEAGMKTVFHAGVGRPAVVYVLYPIGGKLALLRGAVLTYCNFTRDNALTHEDWRRELDRNSTEGRPSWLEPLFAP